MINDDFISEFYNALDYIPQKFKIDVEVTFDDLDGWAEENLKKIIEKNMLLRAKVHRENYISRNKLAGSLCVCGIVFILLSIMISRVWADDSFWKDFALYILDIIATVPFWGAMEFFSSITGKTGTG